MQSNSDDERTASPQSVSNAAPEKSDGSVPVSQPEDVKPVRGFKFWLCIVSLMISNFIVGLELTGVSTALPVILNVFQGSQFEWVGSAYSLAATAFMPLVGALAQVFGRRTVTLALLFVLAAGSALSGASQSLNFLIAGRAVQGLGAGGVNTMGQIILTDLVPLKSRGAFQGFLSFAYGIGTGIGPVIAGALANHGQWRWFFYLNVQICGLSAFIYLICLDMRVPKRTLKEKLAAQDTFGNFLVIASTTAVVIGLTWGGTTFPWGSARVLAPLIIGNLGLVFFILYEWKVPRNPVVPLHICSSVTALSGYVQNFLSSLYLLGIIYYLPVFFQASKNASPTGSGIDIFGIPYTVAPAAIIGGITVTRTGRYRPQLWFSWVLLLIAAGLFSTVHAGTSRANVIGYEIMAGVGIGFVVVITFYPVLAPIPLASAPQAVSLNQFLRFLSQVWGITIGGTILQNELTRRLPADFIAQFPGGASIAYAIIPDIASLEEPLKTQVRDAFAESLRVFWQVLIGVSALGLVSSLAMKGLPLHTAVSRDFALKNKREQATEGDQTEPKDKDLANVKQEEV